MFWTFTYRGICFHCLLEANFPCILLIYSCKYAPFLPTLLESADDLKTFAKRLSACIWYARGTACADVSLCIHRSGCLQVENSMNMREKQTERSTYSFLFFSFFFFFRMLCYSTPTRRKYKLLGISCPHSSSLGVTLDKADDIFKAAAPSSQEPATPLGEANETMDKGASADMSGRTIYRSN